jgi:hypothetical protein
MWAGSLSAVAFRMRTAVAAADSCTTAPKLRRVGLAVCIWAVPAIASLLGAMERCFHVSFGFILRGFAVL